MGRNELFADLSRNVGPSSAGAVVTRNQLRVRWTRAMTPRLSLLAGLRGTYDEDVDPVATFQPRSLCHRRRRTPMVLAGGILPAGRL